MENLILIVVLVLILGAALTYIMRARKKGVKCIGCPAGGQCPGAKGKTSCGGCKGDYSFK